MAAPDDAPVAGADRGRRDPSREYPGGGVAAPPNASPDASTAPPARRAADRPATGAGGAPASGPRPDRALLLLLLAAEREARIGVTVCVAGVVVSGRLVSTRSYCRALADQFASAGGGTDMDETFAEAFRSLVDEAADVAHGDRRATPDAAAYEQSVGFVHLAEARVVGGAGVLPHARHGVLWRCRVADVQGWALGEVAGA